MPDDETTILPRPRTKAARLAWSESGELDDIESSVAAPVCESWGTTLLSAVVLVISGLAVALVVGFALWGELQHHEEPWLHTVAPGDVRPQ